MEQPAQVVARSGVTSSLRTRLLDLESRAGGWPYYRGKGSRIEPTCWALLALSRPSASAVERAAVARGRAFLRSLVRPDGLLADTGVPQANYAWSGLALLALNDEQDLELANRIAGGLLSVRGIQIEGGPSGTVRQDGSLQGWSWTEGTFSWVEPTAWCLLALKVRRVASPLAASRIADAEAVLFDRVCESGGWNYGNSQVLTQDLRPYVPTTALALIALRDKVGHPAVVRSLRWLEEHAHSERASFALTLATLALDLYGRTTEAVERALLDQEQRTGGLGSAHLTAMTLFALTTSAHRTAALRIA